MDVEEKLIFKEGTYEFPAVIPLYDKIWMYSQESTKVFTVRYEYWYDGRLFLLGSFDQFSGGSLSLIEAETGAIAVSPLDFTGGRVSVERIIKKFKEKLKKSGITIGEVTREYKNNNLVSELWLINSLII